MPSFDFSLVYPYRYDDSGVLAPLLPVRLSLESYTADLVLLVDTGAERTLLNGTHLRAAGLDIFAGNPLNFQGFAGARMVAYLHRVRLEIGEYQLDSEIAFSTQPLLRQVMGRDLMAYFGLALRERSLEFYLAPEALP